MTHRIAVGTLLISLVICTTSLCADQTEGEQAFQSYANHVLGGVWKTTTQEVQLVDGKRINTGKTTQAVHEYRPLAGGKFLQLITAGDGQRDPGVNVLGVNPATDEFTWWFFGRKTLFTVTMQQEKPGVWVSTAVGANPEGKPTSFKARLSIVDQDQLVDEPIERIVGGEKQDTVAPKKTWTRHEGTIAEAAPAVESDATDTPVQTDADKAFRSYAEFAVGGSWQAEGQEGSHSYNWLPGKSFVHVLPDNPTGGIGILGVDPKTSQATFWWFIEAGLIASTVRTEKAGEWILEGHFLDAEKKTVTTKSRLVKVDDRKALFEQTEMAIDGAVQPLQSPVTFVRINR